MTVTLKGYIDVPADRLDAVRAGMADHIRLSRAEPGCIRFDMHEGENGRFYVDEEFVDAAAFEHHQDRNRASPWWKTTDGIPRHFDVSGLDE